MNQSPREPCNSQRVLQALLDETLPPEAEAELTKHLSQCKPCRREFNRIAADDSFRREVADRLSDSRDDSALLRTAILQISEETPALDGPIRSGGSVPDYTTALEVACDTGSLPARIDHYELVDFVGRGGMGIVFKAKDLDLDRFVAVKFLSPEQNNDDRARERFLREGRAIAAVNHPSIVTIHAVRNDGPLPYLVMELVDGESLHERLNRVGRLSVKATAKLGFQVASGLHAAHREGVLHRDVKPGNILLESKSGRAKLTDFGLALTAGDVNLTQTGVLVGTPAYLSPEVVNEQTIDHRSDLFSLGSVLYLAVTAKPAIDSKSVVGVIRQISSGDIPAATEVDPEIPQWISSVISRLHALEPNDRFQSAGELASTIRLGMNSKSTYPPGRRRFRAMIGAVLISVPLLLFLVRMFPSGESAAPKQTAATEEATATEQDQKDTVSKPGWVESPDVPATEPSVSIAESGRTVPSAFPETQPASIKLTPDTDKKSEPTPDAKVASVFLIDGPIPEGFDSLEEAVVNAPPGSTVLVRSNDRLEVQHTISIEHPITLAAAPGFSPSIVLRPDGKDESILFACEDTITLRGLSLTIELPDLDDVENGELIAVDGDSASVRIENCRLSGSAGATGISVHGARMLEIVNSAFCFPGESAINWMSGKTLRCENSLFVSELPFEIESQVEPQRIELRRCTVVGNEACFRVAPFEPDADEVEVAAVSAEACVFHSGERFLVLGHDDDPGVVAAESWFRWDGRQNAWTRNSFSCVRVTEDEEEVAATTIRAWCRQPNVSETGESTVELSTSRLELSEWFEEHIAISSLQDFTATDADVGIDASLIGPTAAR